MSIDFFLHKRIAQNKITKAELDLIDNPDIVIAQVSSDEVGDVSFFTAMLKNSPFASGYEYSLQPDGRYWTYIYDYEPEDFREFLTVIQIVADELNMQVDNPQTEELNLTSKALFSDKMAKIVDMQRNLAAKLPESINISQTDLDFYRENKEKLVAEYSDKGYYVDSILTGQKGEVSEDFCSWVISIPTVMPPVEKVLVLETPDKDSAAYFISMGTLEQILADGFRSCTEPVLHYLVEPVISESVKAYIFSKATKIK